MESVIVKNQNLSKRKKLVVVKYFRNKDTFKSKFFIRSSFVLIVLKKIIKAGKKIK